MTNCTKADDDETELPERKITAAYDMVRNRFYYLPIIIMKALVHNQLSVYIHTVHNSPSMKIILRIKFCFNLNNVREVYRPTL